MKKTFKSNSVTLSIPKNANVCIGCTCICKEQWCHTLYIGTNVSEKAIILGHSFTLYSKTNELSAANPISSIKVT